MVRSLTPKNSIAIYIGVVVFSMLCRYLKRYYVRDFAVLMEMDMRKDILDSILHKSSRSLDHDKVGDLMSRTTSDVAKVTETIRKTVTEIWDTWLLIISYFVSLLIMNPKIALLSSVFIPVSIIAAELIRHPLYKYGEQYSVLAGKISSNLQQILIGIPVLRLFGAEEQKKQELNDLCGQQVTAGLKEVKNLSFRYPLGTSDAITNITFRARPDEVVGVTGPVGCGKTALCLALSGIYEYRGSCLSFPSSA